MSSPILIWGAGAIGGVIGAKLSQSGLDITLVDVHTGHVAAIRDPEKGLRITGPVSPITVSMSAFTPEELVGSWQRIILAVKAQYTEEACHQIMPYLRDDGFVASFQNGLCEDIVGRILGPERVIGAFVNFGADWVQPGEILYGNRGAIAIGETDGQITQRVRDLHADIQLFEPEAVLTTNIDGFLWGKLAYGSMLFAQAVGQQGIAECLERPDLLGLWRRLIGEIVRIAHAAGVEVVGFDGFDPNAFAAGASEQDAKRCIAAMVAFNRPNAKTHSGVWRDLVVRKRPVEMDMLKGPAEEGRRRNIPCPILDRLIVMIDQIERGGRVNDDQNLSELAKCLV
jgi:2-dehydropantoate 2-reductase